MINCEENDKKVLKKFGPSGIKKATPVVKNLLDETPDFNGKNKVREVLDVANDGANLVDNIIAKKRTNSKITPTLIDWTKQSLVPRLK